MARENGNVLFIILIAVVLFAALSYAVSSSSRSGAGDLSDETLRLKTSQLMQQVVAFRTAIVRIYTLNEVEQIRWDNSVYNASGTIYLPSQTTGTGRTVGLFNQSSTIGHKVAHLAPPEEILALADPSHPFHAVFSFYATWVYVYNARLQKGGLDLGTSGGDEFLMSPPLTDESCAAINKKIFNDPSISTFTTSGGAVAMREYLSPDGSTANIGSTTGIYSLPDSTGCFYDGTMFNRYFEPIRIN